MRGKYMKLESNYEYCPRHCKVKHILGYHHERQNEVIIYDDGPHILLIQFPIVLMIDNGIWKSYEETP